MDVTGTPRHNPDASRYELVVDGAVVGFAEYRRTGDTMVMHHTYTEPAHRGQGIAAEVVGHALDDIRSRGLHVVPSCWYVAAYIGDHPEHSDLVAGPTPDP